MWEIRGKTIPDNSSPYRAEFLKQFKKMGYENMTDEIRCDYDKNEGKVDFY